MAVVCPMAGGLPCPGPRWIRTAPRDVDVDQLACWRTLVALRRPEPARHALIPRDANQGLVTDRLAALSPRGAPGDLTVANPPNDARVVTTIVSLGDAPHQVFASHERQYGGPAELAQ
jgi:hypothetical protein